MKITGIKAQVRNPERVSIFVDEKYALSLGYSQLLDQKVHVGLEVTTERLSELKRVSDFGKAYERALNYALLRPRSLREMHEYCRRKKVDPQDEQRIIATLVARRYVDDHAFARSWVESRALTTHTSQRKLRLELMQKGIAEDIINEALQSEQYDEEKALRDLVAKKRSLTRYQDPQKFMHYLARQGFSFDAIKRALAGDN